MAGPQPTIDRILKWAQAHNIRTGQWPTPLSGRVHGVSGLTWYKINKALWQGQHNFEVGTELHQILRIHLGVRQVKRPSQLTDKKILQWADAHHRRTGTWPKAKSGIVWTAPGEKWARINNAILNGLRGLSQGSSLPRLLNERRKVRNIHDLPHLTIKQILTWADEHHRRTGKWPTQYVGQIYGAPDEKWWGINNALRKGRRGLRQRTTLAKVLAKYRNVPNIKDRQPLTKMRILQWARQHQKRTGEWPNRNSGSVHGVTGETWGNINQALAKGLRRLPGSSSLSQLRDQE